ncbi:dioxygenase [Pseudomonas protegens]|uniref:dioxygenase n=1 Tax=Pseudomonas protegens TaxID=380021 RepID=UPI003D0F8B5B
MNVRISHTASAQQFLEEASGQFTEGGNPRAKAIIYRILRDSVNIIEDLEITPEEFWKAVNYLNVLGARQEAGLLAAGFFKKLLGAGSVGNSDVHD